jgi:hypothetical protein
MCNSGLEPGDLIGDDKNSNDEKLSPKDKSTSDSKHKS